jgi:hypothetical protein
MKLIIQYKAKRFNDFKGNDEIFRILLVEMLFGLTDNSLAYYHQADTYKG